MEFCEKQGALPNEIWERGNEEAYLRQKTAAPK